MPYCFEPMLAFTLFSSQYYANQNLYYIKNQVSSTSPQTVSLIRKIINPYYISYKAFKNVINNFNSNFKLYNNVSTCDTHAKSFELTIKKWMRLNTHFNKVWWEFATNIFKEQISHTFTKARLKNKWDEIKKDWRIWKKIDF
jgi:hypothetical protein